MERVLLIIIAYLIGSIPTGVVVARLFQRADPRELGSGNIGATNVLRTLGKKAGAITFAGDVLKGVIPTVLALLFLKSQAWVCVVAFTAFTGHLYPVFLGFKGGKGVATAVGLYLALSPLSILLGGIVFGGVLIVWRYVSLSSMSAAASMPAFLWMLNPSSVYPLLGVAIGILIIIRHKENIERLRKGEENRVGR